MKKLLFVCSALAILAACSTADGDGDGVDDSSDICPESSGEVDEFGCAEAQEPGEALVAQGAAGVDLDGDGVIRPTERLLAAPPATGETRGGFFPISLGGDENPHLFYVHESNILDLGVEFHAGGDVFLVTPGGFVTLKASSLVFTQTSVEGSAALPLPGFGFLEGAEASALVQATVGFSPAEELDALEVPLAPGRDYLHFTLVTGGVLSVGELSLSTRGPGAMVVVDPLDPAIFLAGDLLGLSKLGPLEDVTLGISLQGLIPFEPLVEPAGFEPFSGNLFVRGSLGVPALPLTIEGETVVSAEGTLADNDDALLGANGVLSLTADVLGVPVLDVELVDATAVVTMEGERASAIYEGRPSAATFSSLPLVGEFTRLSGELDDEDGGVFEGEGAFLVEGAFLTSVILVPVPDLPIADADLVADRDGIHIGGPVDGEINIAGVSMGAGTGAELSFQPDGSDFEIRLSGRAQVGDEVFLNALVIIDPTGLRIE